MGLVLLLLSLVGSVLSVVLVVLAAVTLVRAARRRRGAHLLRGLALAAAAGGVAAYVCGLTPVAWDALDAGSGGADSAPPRPCRTGPPDRWYHVDGWEAGFVPVRFECHLTDGRSYTNDAVPSWVNPTSALLVVAAAGCFIGARASTESAERRASKTA